MARKKEKTHEPKPAEPSADPGAPPGFVTVKAPADTCSLNGALLPKSRVIFVDAVLAAVLIEQHGFSLVLKEQPAASDP